MSAAHNYLVHRTNTGAHVPCCSCGWSGNVHVGGADEPFVAAAREWRDHLAVMLQARTADVRRV